VAISYAAPIFITIGAALFLGERLRFRRVAAIAASIIGVFIILRPGFEHVSIGQLAQLAAAPLFAASVLIAKRMTTQHDPGAIVAMLSLVCTLALMPGAILYWRQPTVEEIMWLGLTAVFATLGHYTMTLAYRAAPITITLPVTFLQLVWATVLGIIVFSEPLDPFVILGGVTIVAAATYIAWRESLQVNAGKSPDTGFRA
jgi:drug/metabolite transporter (DMT)-like permease